MASPKFPQSASKSTASVYTPSCVVRRLVEMLALYTGRIYPTHGVGGMLFS